MRQAWRADTIYFWWRNTRHPGSSDDAPRSCKSDRDGRAADRLVRIDDPQEARHAAASSRAPSSAIVFSGDAVGWMPRLIPRWLREAPDEGRRRSTRRRPRRPPRRTTVSHRTRARCSPIGILMAFGHSFLACRARVAGRSIASWIRHGNLMKAGLVIFIYSLLFTSLVSFFA
jgi:hypothetical protein